jgi:HK97 family phage portal protein
MSILNLFKKASPQESTPKATVKENTQRPIQENNTQKRDYTPPLAWGNTISIDFANSSPMGMKIATVFRCVDILGSSVASLGLNVYRKIITKQNAFTGDTDGYFGIDATNPLNYLLNLRPNQRLNAFDFIKNAVAEVHLYGNAYIYPQYGMNGISSLILLSPYSVTYDKNSNIYYVHDAVNSIFETLTANDIIHIRNVSLDGGYTGLSTINYAAEVLGIATAEYKQSQDVFQPGSTQRGILSGDAEATARGFGQPQDDQLASVGNRVESQIRSGQKIVPIPGAMKFSPLTMSPADLKLLESEEFTVLEICRFFGVHPDKVFYMKSANYKASGNSQTAYLTDTLQPILRKFENEFTIKLISRSLQSNYKIQFNMEDYFETDLTTKATYMTQTVQNGTRTPNEWRKKDGYSPVEGGDQSFISCNLAPLNSAKIKGETPGNEPSPNTKN